MTRVAVVSNRVGVYEVHASHCHDLTQPKYRACDASVLDAPSLLELSASWWSDIIAERTGGGADVDEWFAQARELADEFKVYPCVRWSS